jgi:hypothetical protein
MRGIDRTGKRKADAALPPSEGSSPSRPSSPQFAAPEALRRRTDSGYVAGHDRADGASPQAGLRSPRGAHVPLSSENPVAPHVGPSSPLPAARLHLVHEATSDAHLLRPGADTLGNIGAASPPICPPGAAPFELLQTDSQKKILDFLPSDAPSRCPRSDRPVGNV